MALEDYVVQYCGNTRKFVARAWYAVLFFSFIIVICSFAVLAQTSAGEGFAAFWSMIMVVCVAAGGTMVFRKYQTEAAVGFLLGVTGMMAQLFFLLFIVFCAFAGEEAYGSTSTTDRTFAAFAFFLMTSYTVIASSLFIFRADLLPAANNVVAKQEVPAVSTTAV
ncbi:hypothetical protein TrLO_g8939 [Triparma laevis f. longispina]|uniref:Uncharacterized protein n=1 Tax=Triparma laevis f. longispina TaxID=1714387 RepID=A0A9W7L0A9_9STRA|nr:hypothetical protein TrLO_g8939 [Triparma laevis f. longispina]